MSEFTDIFGEVIRIVTFQPREARMRYANPQWEERMPAPRWKTAPADAVSNRNDGKDAL